MEREKNELCQYCYGPSIQLLLLLLLRLLLLLQLLLLLAFDRLVLYLQPLLHPLFNMLLIPQTVLAIGVLTCFYRIKFVFQDLPSPPSCLDWPRLA